MRGMLDMEHAAMLGTSGRSLNPPRAPFIIHVSYSCGELRLQTNWLIIE